jgi:predicted lipid carrier protein YhbT
MGDATVKFFDDLGARGRHLLPARYDGTIRVDLSQREHTEHWMVDIRRGDVSVSRETREADCVMHADHDLFDRLATGQESWLPLLFRGAFVVEGDLRLLAEFRKLLPAPPGAHHPRDFARARRSPR